MPYKDFENIIVSVIIVNYNTLSLTRNCINSIYEKTSNLSFEIILVDNASTDGSKEYFEKDNRITYIYSLENLGFGRANNLGVKIAKGKNIFFLNSDTVLKNNAIKILSDFLDANENVAICGGNLFDRNNKPTHSYLMYFPSVYYELNGAFLKVLDRIRFGKSREFNFSGKPKDVAYVTGADLMMKRSVIDKYGAFDPRFFMYFEETEMCCRIKRAGFKIMSVPEAEIFHFQGASTTKVISDIKIDSFITYFYLTADRKYFKRVICAWKFHMLMILFSTFFLKPNKFNLHIKSYYKISKRLEKIAEDTIQIPNNN